MSGQDPTRYAWWLASRASGLVALALITLSVIIGLLMASRLIRRRGAGARMRRLHESTTLAGLVAISVHGLTLVADPWLHPGIRGVLVPFAMSFKPAFTGLGIIGGYLAALLGLSFYARRRIGARLWRRLHRLTIVAYALSLVHAIGSGTDAVIPAVRTAMLSSGFLVAALLTLRLLPRRTTERAPRRAPVPAREGAQ